MNLKSYYTPLLLLCTALLLTTIFSCDQKSGPVAFPLEKSEFLPPSSEPLRISQPKKINWLVNDSTTFKTPVPIKVDLAAVPSKPFYPDRFIPIDQPMTEMSLVMRQDTVINFKDLPSKPINFKTSILEPPVQVKARLPKLNKSASLGIFDFGEDQGMPAYLVSTMMEDSNGMMWIATDKGICRFDGEHIDIFDVIDSIFTGAQAVVTSMLEDENGRIWVYTAEMGFYVIDLQAGIVRNASQFGSFRGNSMIMDSRGMIWFSTQANGIYIVDPNDFSAKHVAQVRPNDSGNALLLVEDGFGKIWTGSDSGLSVIDFDEGTIKTIEHQNENSFSTMIALFSDSKNRIWVGTAEKGVSIIDPNQNKIQILGHEQGITGNIIHFTEGNTGNVWMSSYGEGVYIFDPSKQTLKHLNEDKGLSDDLAITSFLDSQGQIWITTNKGLNLIDTAGLMPNFLTEADGLSWPNVWSFMEDKHGDLWLGSWERMDLYDSENNTIKRIDLALQLNKTANMPYDILPMPSGDYLIRVAPFGVAIFSPELETITPITQENGLTNGFPSALHVDRSGKIWSGAFRNYGVEVFDQKTNTTKRITNKQGLIGNIVWSISEDVQGQIWIGTDVGINIINQEENTISYLMEHGKVNERNNSSFLIDNEERIWMGTRTGILVVDQKNDLLTSIYPENGLISETVYTIYEDNGVIYAGTANGLSAFTPPANFVTNDEVLDVKSFGKEQGMIFNDYNAEAAIVYNNKLWLGIETEVLTVTEIPQKDTIPSTTYISGIGISDKTRGFYDTNAILEKYPKLDTLFTSQKDTFYISGKLPKETSWLKENNITWDGLDGYFNLPVNLSIPFEQNYVSFEFTGTQLKNRNKTRYSYFLEGIDTAWSDISNEAFSKNYRNLPAGDYRFEVRSRTFDGIWSQPAEFSFTILPHWTNTWWAWLLYIIIFMTIVGSIVQYRSRALKNQNIILEEKVKHRTAQLNKSVEDLKATQSQLIQSEKMASLGELTAGIAHEIQNPLNFVNNFSEVNSELIEEMKEELNNGNLEEVQSLADDINENEKKIMFHGKRADSIVKGMLQHSRASGDKKEPTNINALVDEYLRLAYHGLRAKDKSFNADMHTDLDERIKSITVISQDIGRVVLNLVTNAFYAVNEKAIATKASGDMAYKPLVSVATKKKKDSIIITVTDNGNGIPDQVRDKIFQPFFTTKPTGQGTGLGLSLSYDIVRTHGGSLSVESTPEIGTTFTVVLIEE